MIACYGDMALSHGHSTTAAPFMIEAGQLYTVHRSAATAVVPAAIFLFLVQYRCWYANGNCKLHSIFVETALLALMSNNHLRL